MSKWSLGSLRTLLLVAVVAMTSSLHAQPEGRGFEFVPTMYHGGSIEFQRRSIQAGGGDWEGIERPNAAVDFRCRQTPVDYRFGFSNFFGIAGAAVILRRGRSQSLWQVVQHRQ